MDHNIVLPRLSRVNSQHHRLVYEYCVHENNPQRTGHLIITVSVEVALLELVGLLICAIAERQVVF